MSEEMIKIPIEEPTSKAEPTPTAAPLNPVDWAREVFRHFGNARAELTALARQQNDLLLKAIDEGIELVKTTPTPDLDEWARQSLETLGAARRNIVQLAQIPPDQLIGTAKEVAASQVSQAVETATDYAGAGAAALIKARTGWLDFVGRKNEELAETVREELKSDENSAAAALAEFSRQVVGNYVEIQKRWLELAEELPFIKSHLEPNQEAEGGLAPAAVTVETAEGEPPAAGDGGAGR